ncbi:MAG: hypothetical protein AB1756_09600 [Acidobacteriota bacterium]
MSFSEIAGNRKVIELLEKGVRGDALFPSLIFYGKEGVGKKLTAMTMAKGFNCESGIDVPCNRCRTCRTIDSLNCPDVQLILPEFYDSRVEDEKKSRSLKIDQIRNLIDNIHFRPYSSRKKVYVIDHAETLTEESSNALLKTLEEPPGYAVIILLTTAYHSLLPTIRSRCWGLAFNPIPSREIEDFLIRKKGFEQSKARKLSILSEGSLGKALQEDLEDFIGRSEKLMALVEEASQGKLAGAMRWGDEMQKDVEKFQRDLNILSSLFRDIIVLREAKDRSFLINENLTERLMQQQDRLAEKALSLLEIIEEVKESLNLNINKKIAAERILFELSLSL